MYRPIVLTAAVGLSLGFSSLASAADKTKEKPAKKDFSQRVLQQFDKNNDGGLEADELTAFIDAFEQHRADANKTKKPGKEAEHMTAEALLKKYDANNDGKLDAAELQTMGTELHAKHEKKKTAN